ncbi:Protein transport Sec61-beta/Sbh [Phytophthora cactorum]|nr:Protein transport Sec61-beta/Sbh [Phytophthora cactorum]
MRAVIVAAWLSAIATDGTKAAITCSTTAATVSNFTASTTFAAAQIEYADCSTKVVRVVTTNDGTTQLDLSSKKIVNVKSLPSVMQLMASSSKLASLHNFSFPDSLIEGLSVTSTVKLAEFEVRQTDATLFANLQTFNVSTTTSLTCSDSTALYRYVQNTLLCVLADDVFNSNNNPRRSKFLLFAAVSLSLACVGLMSTLAPRTLYERYQKKKYMKLRSKKQQQQQLPPAAGANGALTGKKPAPTASAEGAAASGLRNRRPVAAARSGQNTGRGMGGSSAGILRFYTDDSPGLKIGPTTVLVSCLMFVGFVVLLHVWGKFRG